MILTFILEQKLLEKKNYILCFDKSIYNNVLAIKHVYFKKNIKFKKRVMHNGYRTADYYSPKPAGEHVTIIPPFASASITVVYTIQ